MDIRALFGQKKKERRDSTGGVGLSYGGFAPSVGALQVSAFYRSIEVICQSVAQLPINVFAIGSDGSEVKIHNNPTARLLNRRPDARMTRYTFMSTMVNNMLLKGNAFAIIHRSSNGAVTELEHVPADNVTIQHDGYYHDVKYIINTREGSNIYSPNEVLHFMHYTDNGVVGKPIRDLAYTVLNTASSATQAASDFFANGANLNGILKSPRRLAEEQKKEVKESWLNTFFGSKGGVAVLDSDLDFQSVSVDPSNAQLLETRQYDVVEIARYTGCNPVKLFDLSKSSYSTVEATQLSFLTDTLQPLLEKIEEELEYKLFPDNIDVKFDTSVLLRNDKASQASVLSTLKNNGIMTTNEARAVLELAPVDGGDELTIQVNMTKLDNLTTDDNGEGN